MDTWLLILSPVALLMTIALIGFIGCKFDSSGAAGPPNLGLSDYSITILEETDLVSYWRLRDPACAAGDTASDEKTANPGTFRIVTLPADAPLLSPAAAGTLQCSQPALLQGAADDASIDVDGGYVRVPFSPELNPGTFSVEAWVRPEWSATETGVFRCIVASREDTGAAEHGYVLYAGPVVELPSGLIVDPTPHWQAWVGDGTDWQAVVSTTPVVRGQVTYLCATCDGTTLTLYAANESMDLDADPATGIVTYSPNPAKPLYVGMGATERAVPDPGPLYPFKGLIQEVAVYRRALTGEAVTKHIMSGLGL